MLLNAWLNADLRHKGAYIRARAIEDNISRVASLSGGITPPAPTEAIRQAATKHGACKESSPYRDKPRGR